VAFCHERELLPNIIQTVTLKSIFSYMLGDYKLSPGSHCRYLQLIRQIAEKYRFLQHYQYRARRDRGRGPGQAIRHVIVHCRTTRACTQPCFATIKLPGHLLQFQGETPGVPDHPTRRSSAIGGAETTLNYFKSIARLQDQ